MSHWAEIDENNVVIRVTVGSNDDPNEGYDWLIENLGGRWIQTSYNHNFRKQYAGVDFTYDEDADVFVAPQPYPSWVLDDNHDWEPPVGMPDDGKPYRWDEDTVSWVETLVPPQED